MYRDTLVSRTMGKLLRWRVISALTLVGILLGIHRTASTKIMAQEGKVENVILITLDGLRCQEVFGGIDERLVVPEMGVKHREDFLERFGGATAEQRRRRLMPFLWESIEKGGWIAGDRQRGSEVRVTNGRYFSYPGYSELLCGFGSPAIDSNAKRYNPEVTVLEWMHRRPGARYPVMAFCSWDVFPFIINDQRSGIPVNAGWMDLTVGQDSERLSLINMAAENLFHEWASVRYDVFTAIGAIEAMQAEQPRVLYVALGETDDWAHMGRYDRYIESAHYDDALIRRIWETAQRLPAYRQRTALVITTDHGRGDGREEWKSHGRDLPGSDAIWVAAWGAGIALSGVDAGGRFTQSQIAATVAGLLGEDFTAADSRIAPPLPILFPAEDRAEHPPSE
ncbi:MAG: hypothetical protein KatS3mg111_1272 [Pirellulaceae bacterium]|nr:MAG: hypothetical protein KatS3mg111_1272 [Pirellulaceae bacterium]